MKPVDAPIRRSLLITPGSRPDRIARAAATPCDGVVIDLEDGVAPGARQEARVAVTDALARLDFGARERAVRVNAPGTPDLGADLASLDLAHVDTLWLPKVETPDAVAALDAVVPQSVALVLSIETPRGLLAAAEVAAAGAEWNARCALFFGSGDYCMETGALPTAEGLRVPRALIVAAAAACDLQAIDAAYFLDPKDAEATRADARLAREQGFDGKLVFHPAQIDPANAVFAPTAEDVARAKRLVEAFHAAHARGEGTLIVDGVFLAVDTVRPLERVLWMAGRLGLDPLPQTSETRA